MKYDFQCEKCGVIEIEHSINEEHPEKCPECSNVISRVYSPVPVKFTGSGYYSTDSVLDDPDPDEVLDDKITGKVD